MRGGKGLSHAMPVTKQAPHSNLTRGGPQTQEVEVATAQVAPHTGRNLEQETLGGEALPNPSLSFLNTITLRSLI